MVGTGLYSKFSLVSSFPSCRTHSEVVTKLIQNLSLLSYRLWVSVTPFCILLSSSLILNLCFPTSSILSRKSVGETCLPWIYSSPTHPFFSFEAATTAANWSIPQAYRASISVTDEGRDEKTEIPPLKNLANVFLSKFILSLVNTFKITLKPQGKNGKSVHFRSYEWS